MVFSVSVTVRMTLVCYMKRFVKKNPLLFLLYVFPIKKNPAWTFSQSEKLIDRAPVFLPPWLITQILQQHATP